MMVHTSMDVDVYNVSIHGWAGNAHRTPSHLHSNFIMPHLLQCLFQAACLMDPILHKTTCNIFVQGSPWRWLLQGRRTHSIPKRLLEKKKPSMCLMKEATINSRLWTCLFPIAVSVFRVGCPLEGWLTELIASHHLRELPSFP